MFVTVWTFDLFSKVCMRWDRAGVTSERVDQWIRNIVQIHINALRD